jgi:hypothetical protein
LEHQPKGAAHRSAGGSERQRSKREGGDERHDPCADDE